MPLIGDKGYIRNIDSVEERRLRAEEPEGLVLGFSWYEPPPEREDDPVHSRFVVIGMLCSVAGVAMFLAAFAVTPVLLLLGVVLLPVGLGLWAHGAYRAHRPKTTDLIVNALTFRTDGQIRATDPNKAKIERDTVNVHWDTLKRTVDDIANITLRPMPANSGGQYRHNHDPNDRAAGYPAYSVEVDFSTGERFTAARYLNEDDGRVINIQLNQALEKIRAARDAMEGAD